MGASWRSFGSRFVCHDGLVCMVWVPTTASWEARLLWSRVVWASRSPILFFFLTFSPEKITVLNSPPPRPFQYLLYPTCKRNSGVPSPNDTPPSRPLS